MWGYFSIQNDEIQAENSIIDGTRLITRTLRVQ